MKREYLIAFLSMVMVLSLLGSASAVVPYTSFNDVYDFNSPWNSGGAWAETNISSANWDNSVSGFLDYTDSHAAKYAFWKINNADPVGVTDDWTFEVSVKVNGQGTQTGNTSQAYAGSYVGIMNSDDELSEMVIQSNAIHLRTDTGWVTLDSNNNSDTYHQIRLTRTAAGGIKVWRDNAPLTLGETVDNNDPGYFSTSFVIFGDVAYAGGTGNADGLDVSMDYIAFDIGNAFDIPEPATMLMLAAGSLGWLFRKRR